MHPVHRDGVYAVFFAAAKPAHTGRMRRRSCQRKRACRTQLHEEKGISPQLIRRRRKMPQVFFAWRRGKGRFASFDALVKGRGRRHSRGGCYIRPARPNFAAGAAGMSADEPAAPFCLMPGSQPECLRHSRGKKSLAGQKDGRHFAAGRETGIFPAKSAFDSPMWSRQAKLPQAISTPRLGVSKNPPAGRPRALASYRSALFMGHSVWVLSGGDRPADAGNPPS